MPPLEDNRVVIEHSDWTGGNWFALGPDNGPKAKRVYDSVNMQVYENGNLGPRPNLRVLANIADGTLNRTTYIGSVCLHQPDDFQEDSGKEKYLLIFKSGGDLVKVTFGNGVTTTVNTSVTWAHTATFLALPDRYTKKGLPFSKYGRATGIYDTALSGYVSAAQIKYGGEASTAISYPGGATPGHIFKFKSRYWAFGDPTINHRVWYSAIENPLSWPAANFFNLGPNSKLTIVGAWPLIDHIIFCTLDHKWYTFSYNTIPSEGTIRYIGTYRIPDHQCFAANLGDSVMFLNPGQAGITVVTPDEIDINSLDYVRPGDGTKMELTKQPFFQKAITALKQNAVHFGVNVNNIGPFVSSSDVDVPGDHAIEFVNGAWVRSVYFGDLFEQLNDKQDQILDWFSYGENAYGCIASDPVNNTQGFTVYTRAVCENKPTIDVLEDEKHLDKAANSSPTYSHVVLPRFYAPLGKRARIDRIIVDYDWWWDGNASRRPSLELHHLQLIDGGDDSENATWTQIHVMDWSGLTRTSSDPVRNRLVVAGSFSEWLTASMIRLSKIRNIAISKVVVIYDTRPDEPITITQPPID